MNRPRKKIMVVILSLLLLVGVFQPLAVSANVKVPAKPVNAYGIDGRPYYLPSGKQYNLVNYDLKGQYKFNTRISKGYPLGYWHATLNGTPKAAYCIEYGVKVVRSGTASSYSQYFNDCLPDSIQDALTLVLLYGATLTNDMPSNPGGSFNRGDWHVATQVLAWEFQQQLRDPYVYTKKTGPYGMNSNYFYNLIKGRSAEKAYDYMVRKIKAHRIIPSFTSDSPSRAPSYIMKYDYVGQTFKKVLEDKNGYEDKVKTNIKSITETKEGNVFTFKSKEPIASSGNSLAVSVSKDLPPLEGFFVYEPPGGQGMCIGQRDDPVAFFMNLRTEEQGKLKLSTKAEDKIMMYETEKEPEEPTDVPNIPYVPVVFPFTGDTFNGFIPLMLLLLAGIGLGSACIYNRKETPEGGFQQRRLYDYIVVQPQYKKGE